MNWAREMSLSLSVRQKIVFFDDTITINQVKVILWIRKQLTRWLLRGFYVVFNPNWWAPFLFIMKQEVYGFISRQGFVWPADCDYSNWSPPFRIVDRPRYSLRQRNIMEFWWTCSMNWFIWSYSMYVTVVSALVNVSWNW